jgi:hypothetical protein
MPGDGLVGLQQTGGPDHIHHQLVEVRGFRGVHPMRSHTTTQPE